MMNRGVVVAERRYLMMTEYASMSDLAKRFDVTRNVLGKWLVEIGLRIRDSDRRMKPSRRAFEEGFIKAIPHGRNQDGFFYIWHREKTIAALTEAGYKLEEPASPPVREHPLVAPFTCEASSTNGFVILNRDGEAVLWTVGEIAANFLTKMLNLAEKYGKLP